MNALRLADSVVPALYAALVLTVCLDVSAAAAQAPAISSSQARVDDGVVVAGLVELDRLRAAHAGEIVLIDLRTEEEGTLAEADAARAMGFTYQNIPVAGAAVDQAQVDALQALLATAAPETLVVVHCVSGNRAGMLWGATALQRGESLESVHRRLDGVLTKQASVEALDGYAASLHEGR